MYDPLTTIEDTETVLRRIEPNTDALNWEPIDAAVQKALASPAPDDVAPGTPLLRTAWGATPASLLDVLWHTARRPGHSGYCDVTLLALAPDDVHVLWVPAGRSVVQVTMCGLARESLEAYVGPSLVWE